MINKLLTNTFYITAILALSGCQYLRTHSVQDLFKQAADGTLYEEDVATQPLRAPSSIVVCRDRQCAPAKLSMSREYIYNSLMQLFDNNNYQKALICQADAASHTCLENYITLPITAGITPTNAYIDYVKITDVIVGKKANKINLILNYNVTYGGQTPDCTPSQSILFARNINHVLLEDSGYTCKMTSIGHTTVKTLFAIDYIDLDYGFIGGYYSIGFSGPAYGGGNGYMMLRLPKNAYPLTPQLMTPKQEKKPATPAQKAYRRGILDTESKSSEKTTDGVQIFPISRTEEPQPAQNQEELETKTKTVTEK